MPLLSAADRDSMMVKTLASVFPPGSQIHMIMTRMNRQKTTSMSIRVVKLRAYPNGAIESTDYSEEVAEVLGLNSNSTDGILITCPIHQVGGHLASSMGAAIHGSMTRGVPGDEWSRRTEMFSYSWI